MISLCAISIRLCRPPSSATALSAIIMAWALRSKRGAVTAVLMISRMTSAEKPPGRSGAARASRFSATRRTGEMP